MEFTLVIDWGFDGDRIEFTTSDFWKTLALAGFAQRMDDESDDEFADEEYEYDDEGVAYWLDAENDVWYFYDEESDDWYECEEDAE